MNNERRKDIARAKSRLEEIQIQIDELIGDIENIRDAEQGAFDAMPESFQEGDRGQTIQEAIDGLENALSELEGMGLTDAGDYLENAAA